MRYPFEIREDIMIGIFNEKAFLIDTGAPMSFGRCDVEVESESFEVASDYMGVGIEAISEKVNFDLDGLMGADILNEFTFTIHWHEQTIEFAESPVLGEGIELEEVMGLPYIADVTCGDQTFTCYVDTGASITHINAIGADHGEFAGTHDDFHPSFGDFTTSIHECSLALGGSTFKARVGQLPEGADMLLGMLGVDGVLGSDLWKAYKTTFIPSEAKLILENY